MAITDTPWTPNGILPRLSFVPFLKRGAPDGTLKAFNYNSGQLPGLDSVDTEVSLIVPAIPECADPHVIVSVEAVGFHAASNQFLTVLFHTDENGANERHTEQFFVTTGTGCNSTVDSENRLIVAGIWNNTIIDEGQDLRITVRQTGAVVRCPVGQLRVLIGYNFVDPTILSAPYIAWTSHRPVLAAPGGQQSGNPEHLSAALVMDPTDGLLKLRHESGYVSVFSGWRVSPVADGEALGAHPGLACVESISVGNVLGTVVTFSTSGGCALQ